MEFCYSPRVYLQTKRGRRRDFEQPEKNFSFYCRAGLDDLFNRSEQFFYLSTLPID
jgi:hypothetical protein